MFFEEKLERVEKDAVEQVTVTTRGVVKWVDTIFMYIITGK